MYRLCPSTLSCCTTPLNAAQLLSPQSRLPLSLFRLFDAALHATTFVFALPFPKLFNAPVQPATLAIEPFFYALFISMSLLQQLHMQLPILADESHRSMPMPVHALHAAQ